MEEKDAILLLERLEKFMRDTNSSISMLTTQLHNVRIDVEKIKKHIADKSKIIVAH